MELFFTNCNTCIQAYDLYILSTSALVIKRIFPTGGTLRVIYDFVTGGRSRYIGSVARLTMLGRRFEAEVSAYKFENNTDTWYKTSQM